MDELDSLSLEELRKLHGSLNKGDPLDSMSLDDLRKVHAAEVGNPTVKPAPKSEGTWAEKFHNIRERIQVGETDPLWGMAQNFAHQMPGIPEEVTKGVDALVKAREAHYEKTLAPHGDTFLDRLDGARLVGNLESSLLTPFRGGGLIKAVANGVTDSYMQPNAADGSFAANKALDMGTGGVFGGVLHGAGSLIGSIINPKSANNIDLKTLLDSGVMPSVGQALGKDSWLNRAEQSLSSVPWLGDAIREVRQRGLETWNKATMDEALKPIGYKVTEGGHVGADDMKRATEKGYDWALGGVGDIPSDITHLNVLSGIQDRIDKLGPLRHLIDTPVSIDKAVNGDLTGSNFKTYDKSFRMLQQSLLGNKGDNAATAISHAAPIAGDLRMANRELLDRVSPSSKSLLDDADLAYAGRKTVEKAMSNASSNGGVFTPSQLQTASRQAASDPSIIAAGDGLLQNWADIGNRHIGNTVPDSGSAGRYMAATMDPIQQAGLGLAGNLHTGGLNDAIVSLISSRPDFLKKLHKKGKDLDLQTILTEMAGGLSQEYSPFGRR